MSRVSGEHPGYRRDRTTWAAFCALFAFGFMNAALGPALPYLRETEGISYVTGALHQAAFAIGGGLAGGSPRATAARSAACWSSPPVSAAPASPGWRSATAGRRRSRSPARSR